MTDQLAEKVDDGGTALISGPDFGPNLHIGWRSIYLGSCAAIRHSAGKRGKSRLGIIF